MDGLTNGQSLGSLITRKALRPVWLALRQAGWLWASVSIKRLNNKAWPGWMPPSGGVERTYEQMYQRTYERTYGNSPNFTGLRPLSGPLPKNRYDDNDDDNNDDDDNDGDNDDDDGRVRYGSSQLY